MTLSPKIKTKFYIKNKKKVVYEVCRRGKLQNPMNNKFSLGLYIIFLPILLLIELDSYLDKMFVSYKKVST